MQFLLFLLFLRCRSRKSRLFIEAGRLIGIVPTILLTFGTAIAGTFLMRVQGIATMNRIAQSVEKGEMPVAPVIDGMGIFVAGILLLTPGFLTDAFGLLLFVPPIRRAVGRWIFQKLARSGQVRFSTLVRPVRRNRKPANPWAAGGFKKADDVVDAEFETIDPDETDPEAPPRTAGRQRPNDPKSPWRK